jgi:dihydropteroate synthase
VIAKTYLRPLGLVYGPDARRAVGEGTGGSLGGHTWISFTQAEVIERRSVSIERRIAAYQDLDQELKAPFEAPRKAISGIEMNDGPVVMGIVNATPDSFSDGGKFEEQDAGANHGLRLRSEGAAIVDVGGESTRPGSEPVPAEAEASRVIPIAKSLVAQGCCVSVDTRKASVMREAASAGASIINDVSALTYDPLSLETVAELQLPVVLMHVQGDPRTMQLNPRYDDVALDVYDYLEGRVSACVAGGIRRDQIVIDPGIGFGKTFRHNLDILQQLTLFHGLGVPVLAGASRKGFIGALTGEKQAAQRGGGSAGAAVHAILNGAHILRVHDVKLTVEGIAVAKAAADPENSGI